MPKKRFLSITDYAGREIRISGRKSPQTNHPGIRELFQYDAYVFSALEIPDEVYFFKKNYQNKYLKFYHDFYIVVTVSLNEFCRYHGLKHTLNDWFVVHEAIEYPYFEKPDFLKQVLKKGTLVYKYVSDTYF
jgi:hypothetical protein